MIIKLQLIGKNQTCAQYHCTCTLLNLECVLTPPPANFQNENYHNSLTILLIIIVNTKLQFKNNTFSIFESKFLIIFKTLFLFIKKKDQVQKQKKACKMKKIYPINMKIPGAHLQIVSNQCTHFQKNLCTHLLEYAWTKSCPQTGDRETDGQTDRWKDRQTDRVKIIYPPNFICGGYKKKI